MKKSHPLPKSKTGEKFTNFTNLGSKTQAKSKPMAAEAAKPAPAEPRKSPPKIEKARQKSPQIEESKTPQAGLSKMNLPKMKDFMPEG